MKLKYICSLLFVKDVKRSTKFYRDILGQEIEADLGENVSFKGGFSIQRIDHISRIIFENETRKEYGLGGDNLELYFETEDIEMVQKELLEKEIVFIHQIKEMPWAQKVLRIRDPDGYIVEIGEPIPVLVKRLKAEGLTLDEVARRVDIPIEGIQFMLDSA